MGFTMGLERILVYLEFCLDGFHYKHKNNNL